MEQKVSKKHKRGWSVIIDMCVEAKKVVWGGKKKKMRDEFYVVGYCFNNVTKLYKKHGILFVVENGVEHKFDIKRIEQLQIREHKRQGIQ